MNAPTATAQEKAPQENIAQTLARELPQAKVLFEQEAPGEHGGILTHVLVPNTFKLQTLDNEGLMAHPRRTKAAAKFLEAQSFLDYVQFHAQTDITAVWCHFDPVTYALLFMAVIDEHSTDLPGWRNHTAVFTPRPSVEWGIWTGKNKAEQSQVGFATFIESNEKDIAAGPAFPSSLDMMTMATAFEANSDKTFKSKVRLQSGGVALEYVNKDDAATVEKMRLFEKFQIGVPVFWELRDAGAPVKAWPLVARLKYRTSQGAVTFWYDLIRPDLVHELAALAMIAKIREGLGSVPLRMGQCT